MADVYAKINGKKTKVGTASESDDCVWVLKIDEEFGDAELQDISLEGETPKPTAKK